MTLLAASIFVERLTDLSATCDAAWRDGADAIELRIDPLEDSPIALNAFLKLHGEKKWIVTCRGREEGGRFAGETAERVACLITAAQGTNAYIDFEFADWKRSANIRQKVLLAATGADGRRRLVLSSHHFNGPPNDLNSLIRKIRDVGRASLAANDELVAKVAYAGQSIMDGFAALDAMHAHRDQAIAICMGEHGTWTRLLAKKLGAFATYVATEDEVATAPGQFSLQAARDFRWGALNPRTRVYGVVGDPVGHSLSPMLFNHWFGISEIDALYMPLHVGANEMNAFLDAVHQRTWLDPGGFSVTIPHKESALNWPKIEADPLCVRLGALNTLLFDKDRVHAFNTDSHAAFDSLLDAWSKQREDLRGSSIDVLGAGGAARAMILPLQEFGASVTVYGRSPKRLQCIRNEFTGTVADWNDRVHRTGNVLINTTPIGMWPNTEESPMPGHSLKGCELVFDMVYRPAETRLLRDAARAGCKPVNGLDMFVRQAAIQMELWTGIRPDRVEAFARLSDFLSREESPRCRSDRLRTQATAANQRKSHLFLIGMRGSGKTTVGKLLAGLLKVPHIDTDALITAAAGLSIREIFAAEGEIGFRKQESNVVRQVISQGPAVISLGGGAILDATNVDAIRNSGTVVWLTAPIEVLAQRIHDCPNTFDSRPRMTNLPELEELRTLLVDREEIYRAASHVVFPTENRTAGEVAQAIHLWILDATLHPRSL
ncbi:MAG: type I 3-dehydroquinate dehydratase [Planctomycetes bacterium]|nr:type I 3-dehydroquinate dehydratase [Planctomycetota bacterium]